MYWVFLCAAEGENQKVGRMAIHEVSVTKVGEINAAVIVTVVTHGQKQKIP